MNILTKATALSLVLAASAFSASAFEIKSPKPNAVNQVNEIGTVIFTTDTDWTPDFDGGVEITLFDANGSVISVAPLEYNMESMACYEATFSPKVTKPGMYVINFPANIDTKGVDLNPEYNFQMEIVEGEIVTGEKCNPTGVTPADGSSLVQGTNDFTNIQIQFADAPSLNIDWSLIKLTDQNGDFVEYTYSGFYLATDPMLSYVDYPFINVTFNQDGKLASGTYTLTIPAGAITSPNAILNETVAYSWNYTRTLAEDDPTPLTVSAVLGKASYQGVDDKNKPQYIWLGENAVNVTENMLLGILNNAKTGSDGDAFLLNFNHGEKAGFVSYTLYMDGNADPVLSGTTTKVENNAFLLAWPTETKFLVDTKYTLEFHAYSNEFEPRAEYGNGASLTFTGTIEPYRYSPYSLVVTSPDNDDTVESLLYTKITCAFDGPVKLTNEVSYNQGFGTSAPLDFESKTGREYDTIWYIYLDDYVINNYPSVNVNISAVDENGLRVYGDQGFEDTACNLLTLNLTFCQPRILLNQTNNHVDRIEFISLYSEDGKCVNHAWQGDPVVVDKNGNIVATVDQNYYEEFYSPAKPLEWTGSATEPDPLVLEYKFVPAITEKGKYTVKFPEYMINIGTQFDGISSIAQNFDFYVVDFYNVNFSVDSHSIALPAVEAGKSAVVNVTPAENWKLETLTLNGVDVTNNVADNIYTTPALKGDANIAATFAFDGVVMTPTGIDDVVTELNLRGWSDAGSLFVAGLQAGQVLKVYTLGGSQIASADINSDETYKVSAPAGAYIVTVSDGTRTVALKLINK